MLKRFILALFCVFLSFSIRAQHSVCAAADSIRIVVIGSSTAAGSGASNVDSAWVNRYRTYLQSIHPGNELINLARGGYNTWRLMPDNFNPPANRPSPDTLHNISHALRQNPQGIIINLPSNDAAIGTGLNEQMSNFIHMDSLAKAAGVKVWVCTTQPRNFGAAQIQTQLDVRDSILSYFGARAIDFWSPLANSQHTIDSLYDSGDGVHVNDWGHRRLFQQVKNLSIVDSLVDPVSGVDLSAGIPQWLNATTCGQKQGLFEVTVSNLGTDSLSSSLEVQLIRENRRTLQLDTLRQYLSGIGSCRQQKLVFQLNTAAETNWLLKTRVMHPLDSFSANNVSAKLRVKSAESPNVMTMDTLICKGDSLILLNAQSNDSIRWFSDALLQNQIGAGNNLSWVASQGDSLFLKAYRGPFYYQEKLAAANSHNIQWNGCMFNLIGGQDTVHIDSISFFAGSNGDLQVNLRTLPGSYLGNEGNAAAWSAATMDSVYGAQVDSIYSLHFGPLSIAPADTLGCYLYLENPNHRLSYQSAGSTQVFNQNGLQLQAGTGVSHTFGSTFFPRHFRGAIYYHYGHKPEGQCESELDTLIITRSQIQLVLGNDTVLQPTDTLTIAVPPGFIVQSWSDGSNGDSLLIPYQASLVGNRQYVWLEAIDSLGCLHRDSLGIAFSGLNLNESQHSAVALFPNPSPGTFHLKCPEANRYLVTIFSLNGQQLRSYTYTGATYKLASHLPKGLYLIRIESDSLSFLSRIVIE